jgi:uncharacterized phiE125 gp8 family phage protein
MARTALKLAADGKGDPIIDLADAKRQLNLIDTNDFDVKLTEICIIATEKLDGADGCLKRALRTQDWILVLPSFYAGMNCYGHIELPLPPLQTVTAIKYLDADGNEQTVSTSVYRVVNNGTEKSILMLVTGQYWPTHGCYPDAVRIEFTAGYGDNAEDVPQRFRHAALVWLSHLYEYRGDDSEKVEEPLAVMNLIRNDRIVRL